MDIEEKLKLLRKGKDGRNRSGNIQDTWNRIDSSEDGLSVKEKLERLINLTQRGKTAPPKAEPEAEEKVPFRRESFQFIENAYALGVRYGRIPISMGLGIPGKTLAFLSRDALFEELSLDSALFLDLETTGLSGGTGTLPFLVGMGYYRDGKFKVAQYFLSEMGDEEGMIRELARFIREMEFRSVVTYNGKAFDVPLLETRFALHRELFPLAGLPHLDFLFSARHLWKHKYDSCRLCHLAHEIVCADRDEDIPSAEIPMRYFQYIRTDDRSLIEPIIYHNQEDILSLLGVVIAGAMLVDSGRRVDLDDAADAMDLVGIGRLYESRGHREKSVEIFQKALEGDLSGAVTLTVQKKLSVHFKKSRDWDKAIPLWKGMTEHNQLDSFRELAMYYEHKAKSLEEALRVSEEGLALSLGLSSGHEKDFRKRIERLLGKIRRQGASGGENVKNPNG